MSETTNGRSRRRTNFDMLQTALALNAALLQLIAQSETCPLRRDEPKCWRDCKRCIASHLLEEMATKDETAEPADKGEEA